MDARKTSDFADRVRFLGGILKGEIMDIIEAIDRELDRLYVLLTEWGAITETSYLEAIKDLHQALGRKLIECQSKSTTST
jgi:hypothetical protein